MRSRFSGGMVLPVFETATRMLSEPVWIVTRINPYSGANLSALSSRLIQTSFSSSGSASISYSSKSRLRSRCFAFHLRFSSRKQERISSEKLNRLFGPRMVWFSNLERFKTLVAKADRRMSISPFLSLLCHYKHLNTYPMNISIKVIYELLT